MGVILAREMTNYSDATRADVIRGYVNAKPNKAQAIQLEVGAPWRSSEHEDEDTAIERTLEGCQLRWGAPCALLAVNDDMVAEGRLEAKDMPRVNYTGIYEVSQIPAIRRSTRQRPDVQNYEKAMEPKAMAIHPWGRLFISAGGAGPREAQASALAQCNDDPSRNHRDGDCFVYAVGNNVVISEKRTSPK